MGLVRALSKKGISCKVLTQQGVKNQSITNVEVLDIINSAPHSFLKSLLWDYPSIKKHTEDCYLIHSLIEPYAPLAYSIASRKPFFITAHGTFAVNCFNKKKLKFLFKKVFKKAKFIFAVSNFTKKKILEKIPLDNVKVINNGIDYQAFQVSSHRKESHHKIILSVGVLKTRKGYHISIPAIVQVKKRFGNLKYYIVGDQSDSNYFQKLKELVNKFDLADTVVFLENLSDNKLTKLYYQADLFLLTPVNVNDNFEGFGLVYLEAGACGRPVIGTSNCGAEDAIEDGYNGFLVPQNNPQKTAEAIIKVLDNKDLAQKLGENGQKKAKDMDWKNISQQYFNSYSQ